MRRVSRHFELTAGAGDQGFEFPILLGDVGGTNARFAVVADRAAGMGAPEIVKTADRNRRR